jgi:hypothetical protein
LLGLARRALKAFFPRGAASRIFAELDRPVLVLPGGVLAIGEAPH